MKLLKFMIFALLLFSFACTDDDDPESKDTTIDLTITSAEWAAIINEEDFGEVHLNIAGSTDADTVMVETYGDGEISDYALTLDEDKNFNEDVMILFTTAPDTSEVFSIDTLVAAYKDDEEKQITLISPELSYEPTDCCEDNPAIDLTITSSEWIAIINEANFGEVHLNIAGSTDADTVMVETYGDGEISDYALTLDDDKNFNEDVCISFTTSPDTDILFYSHTFVTAYKGDETETAELKSPVLSYVAMDSYKVKYEVIVEDSYGWNSVFGIEYNDNTGSDIWVDDSPVTPWTHEFTTYQEDFPVYIWAIPANCEGPCPGFTTSVTINLYINDVLYESVTDDNEAIIDDTLDNIEDDYYDNDGGADLALNIKQSFLFSIKPNKIIID